MGPSVFIAACGLLAVACGIQFPDRGLNLGSLRQEHGLSHWTSGEVPVLLILDLCFFFLFFFFFSYSSTTFLKFLVLSLFPSHFALCRVYVSLLKLLRSSM